MQGSYPTEVPAWTSFPTSRYQFTQHIAVLRAPLPNLYTKIGNPISLCGGAGGGVTGEDSSASAIMPPLWQRGFVR